LFRTALNADGALFSPGARHALAPLSKFKDSISREKVPSSLLAELDER
jgi:hypothetical protein